MFYICIETYPGGYVLTGAGNSEAEAIATLNEEASGFPTPPPKFASVQDLRDRFANPDDDLCSLYAGTDEAEWAALVDELLA